MKQATSRVAQIPGPPALRCTSGMTMISEKYDVSKIEAKWQERWKAERIYAWNPSEPREACYIVAAATSLAQLSQLGEKTE